MATVREIARQVGVSPATVSRAINNHPTVAADVRQRILSAVNRAGYVATVGRRSTSNIALLYTGRSSLGSPFDAAVMLGMANRLDDLEYDMVILSAGRSLMPGETLSQMFHRKGIRGVLVRTESRTRDLVEQLAREDFPHVVIGDRFENTAVNSIYADSTIGSRHAIDHLIAQGHRRIAVCTNRIEDSDHRDRIEGYRQALKHAGIEIEPCLIMAEDANLDGGAQLARKIHAMRDRPTAIYIGDPLSAVGAMNELERLGVHVPDDISIIGFDDNDIRFMTHPHLTAVVQDAQELGREAFDLLHQLIEERPGIGVQRVLPTRLELHESTKPPSDM
jgi:DNA-binding LacI/PurR family transcriptional regulator